MSWYVLGDKQTADRAVQEVRVIIHCNGVISVSYQYWGVRNCTSPRNKFLINVFRINFTFWTPQKDRLRVKKMTERERESFEYETHFIR